jgi:hypothetical protein
LFGREKHPGGVLLPEAIASASFGAVGIARRVAGTSEVESDSSVSGPSRKEEDGLMRFVGAISILALCVGSPAFGQDALDKDQKIQDLQKQIAGIQAQLDAMKSDSTTPAQGLDGKVRESPVDPATEPRRLNISAPGIEGIDLFGGIGVRADYWGNYNAAGNGSNDILSVGQETWLGAKAKISEKTSAGVTLHYAGIWGNNTFNGLDSAGNGRLTGGTVTPATNAATNTPSVGVTEAWLSVKDMYNAGIDFLAGRQKIQFGAERIIGDDEWRLNRTVFDGFRLDQSLGADYGGWSLIAVRLQDNDNSGTSELTPTGSNKVDNADLYGFYYTMKRSDVGTLDAYVFDLQDMNYNDPTGAAGKTSWVTYGARWMSNSFGGATFEAEGATQFGYFTGSRTDNYGFGTYGLHLGANWSPEEKIQYFKAVHANYDYATGGTSPEGNFVQLYPSLHGTFGITDFFGWSNIQHFSVGSDFDALDGTIALSYHWNRMASHFGGFTGYNASGGSTVTSNDKDLGQEFDAVYSVECTKSTRVGMGLGYFFPGSGFAQMTGGSNDMVYSYLAFRVVF